MRKTMRWQIAQFAEIRWWQKYLRKKDLADYLEWKVQYWNTLLSQVIPLLALEPGQKVLDAGCGPAGINLALKDYVVDATDPLLNSYRSSLGMPEEAPHVNFKEQSLEDLSESDSYQVVFCMNVINHVANIEKSIENLVNTIKPGGQLVLTVDAHNHQLFRTIFSLIPGDILHPQQLGLKAYQELVEKAGSKVEHSIRLKREFFFSYYLIVAHKT